MEALYCAQCSNLISHGSVHANWCPCRPRELMAKPALKITLVAYEATNGHWVVDNPDTPGSPPVGRGHTPAAALQDYVAQNRSDRTITLQPLTPDEQDRWHHIIRE